MLTPAEPADEAKRIAALKKLGILYTPSEARFDRITRLAARTFGTEMALVSLVAEEEQWFKSSQGLNALSTPRAVSFCGHAILNDNPLVVEDALNDPRFVDNPLVTSEPNIRFYAGQPVRSPDGHRLGTICVIDRTPRHFSEEDAEALKDFAELVEAEFGRAVLSQTQAELIHERDDFQRKALIDGLTRLWNHVAIMEILHREIAKARRGTPISVSMVDIDLFKHVNDTYGHPVGDVVLCEVASRIRRAGRDHDVFGRYGGEEFLGVFAGCDAGAAERVGERIRNLIAEAYFETDVEPLPITVSVGLATFNGERSVHSKAQPDAAAALVAAADAALYRAKGAGRNRVVSA